MFSLLLVEKEEDGFTEALVSEVLLLRRLLLSKEVEEEFAGTIVLEISFLLVFLLLFKLFEHPVIEMLNKRTMSILVILVFSEITPNCI